MADAGGSSKQPAADSSTKPKKEKKTKESKSAKEERAAGLRKDLQYTQQEWTPEKVFEFYQCDPKKGLTSARVQEQEQQYGLNQLTPPKTLPWFVKLGLQFTNFFSLLLIVGGLLCFISFGIDGSDPTNLYLGVVLITVVVITAVFSFFQEAKSEAIMEGFKSMIPKKCTVIRDGNKQVIDSVHLVPGDLVEISDGDQVPADIRIVGGTDIKVDNASLTGESEPVDRGVNLTMGHDGKLLTTPLEANNLIFYTTIINAGSAKGVVIGTGDNTAMGQIAGLTTDTGNEQTPIAREISLFILLISIIAITLGVVFVVISFAIGQEPVSAVVFGIGIIVANVPEGLLATVTVALALTAKRMFAKNVLVKNLQAVETLGSTSVIASDKTGTLTQNRMTVQHCWYNGKIFRTPAARNKPQLDAALKAGTHMDEPVFNPSDPTFAMLHKVCALCNNSSFILKEKGDSGSGIDLAAEEKSPNFNLLGLNTTGDASESGLVKAIQLLRDVEEFRAANPKMFEIKFNSTNKWQLSIHKQEDPNVRHPLLVLKGAPERVIKMCDKINVNGKEEKLTEAWLEQFTHAYESLGGLGERVLGFAYREMKEHDYNFQYESKPKNNFRTDDLTFAGLFSLIDPPREGVPEAVAKCKRARIRVFMVTGDHPITAHAIAKQVGIIDQELWDEDRAIVVKGDDIREWMELPEEQQTAKWDWALAHEQIVWARVSPAHKLLIVENAQRLGSIVAVTGDGVNDAPALKKGNIGIAMGIAGKDVSKEAADMILIDDNFASIVNGVEEGRLIFDNLKKSIAYTLTSNIPEIGPFLLFITINIPLALSTVLILCVDLGTDMIPAISLAHETKEADIMNRPPRNAATDRLVNSRLMCFAYLQIGVMQALAGFFTYMVVLNDYGYAPRILVGTGTLWQDQSLLCLTSENGHVDDCGYACSGDGGFGVTLTPGLGAPIDYTVCDGGCPVPPGDAVHPDPFVEHTAVGFRGFFSNVRLLDNRVEGLYDGSRWSANEAVCSRTCRWYWNFRDLLPQPFPDVATPDSPITTTDDRFFKAYCNDANNNIIPSRADWGFPGRGPPDQIPARAPYGAFYWWNGRQQLFPNQEYQFDALKYAQTAYFISIIVVQWADLLIAKTRKLSIFEQGMHNRFMNFGLVFETILGVILVYVPVFNVIFSTRPLFILHWFPGMPWSMIIFIYDEVRKGIMRSNPDGWIARFTYW
ncbi:unnamed protein product [Pedinophyceae sp. YPF-701]|nr:unnamed protein product [Pedinophyceae sp. YPF-701]